MEGGPEASMGIGSRLDWHGKTKQNPNQSTTCMYTHMHTHVHNIHVCNTYMHALKTLEKSIKLKIKTGSNFLLLNYKLLQSLKE